MKNIDIVRNFVDSGNKTQLAPTIEFTVKNGSERIEMLGTYSPVMSLDWAVVVQKPQREAYRGVIEMQRNGRLLALAAVLLSIGVSIFAARRITSPLQVLTQSSRALARGDFSQRVNLWSRTEIGELAHTFNTMSDELERFVEHLKRAAEENRELFMGSIQMLAGAVDEKDPYTRGHSDRVTRYSLLIAKQMGLPETFLEILRISAQLHDVGKIGIEDHILRKPGALTAEEFEVMKTHTTKGANILRPVAQLAEMLPGIELHHEALDGRGYPYGLQGDQIPLLARVIAVADTFDALTTNRPVSERTHARAGTADHQEPRGQAPRSQRPPKLSSRSAPAATSRFSASPSSAQWHRRRQRSQLPPPLEPHQPPLPPPLRPASRGHHGPGKNPRLGKSSSRSADPSSCRSLSVPTCKLQKIVRVDESEDYAHRNLELPPCWVVDDDGSRTLIRRAASLELATPSGQHILYPPALFSVRQRDQESVGPLKDVHWRPVHFARSPTYICNNGEAGQSRSDGA